jgi:hypothetical protein
VIVHPVDQNTDEWLKLRTGIPTASNASKLVQSDGRPSKSMVPYAQKLAGDLFAGKDLQPWAGNQYTEMGHLVEGQARLAYRMTDALVEEAGFCTDSLMRYGCSPDGLVGDNGLVEIKCLPKLHIAAILYIEANKRPPPDYIAQCQMQMLVTEREWCDLYYYHEELPTKTCRIVRDEKFQTSLMNQINACITERNNTLKLLEKM